MKKYNRALSLLLIICIMFCAFFGSVESSSALVLNPWTIALCGALLTAAGLTFGSPSDMEAAAGSFAGSVSDSIMADLQAKAAEYEASNDNDFFLTLGADIIAAISGWLSGLTSSEGGSVSVDNWISINTSTLEIGQILCSFDYTPCVISPDDFNWEEHDFFFPVSCWGFALYRFENPNWPTGTYKLNTYYFDGHSSVSSNVHVSTFPFSLKVSSIDDTYFTLGLYNNSGSLVSSNSFALSNFATISVLDGVTSIPFDSTWAPDSEDKSKALVPGASVKLPKGLVNSDGALDSDVVGAMTPESVRAGSADIPDVIAGTGTITGTGEGTGIFEGIGSLVLDIPIIGTIASTLSEILEAIKGFFDVSRFDLNFESLKVGLTGVFPFCIPFDFFNAVKMFSSDASSFVFDINLETDYFTIDHTVDLTPFRLPILFFRYVVVFWFGFILISRTKDFMKW